MPSEAIPENLLKIWNDFGRAKSWFSLKDWAKYRGSRLRSAVLMGKDHLVNMWEALWAGDWTVTGVPSVLCGWELNPFEFLLPHWCKRSCLWVALNIVTHLLKLLRKLCPATLARDSSAITGAWLHMLLLKAWSLQVVWGDSWCGFQVARIRVGGHNHLPGNAFLPILIL